MVVGQLLITKWGLEDELLRPRLTMGLALSGLLLALALTVFLGRAFNRITEESDSRFRAMESERDEMQALIDYMGEGVIVLTQDARVLRVNQAAIDLLDFPRPVKLAPIRTLVHQSSLRSLLEGLGGQNLLLPGSYPWRKEPHRLFQSR